MAGDAPTPAAGRREDQLDRLSSARFDLLVIGAGAIGAATAWYAALAGARVAVVDRGDVAGATSSASSKLMHGGLRYLAMGDVGLVREAHRERRAHARIVAPHLVRPLEFVVPVGAESPTALWQVRAGVFLYGALARFADGRNGRISLAAAARRVPPLLTDGLRGAVRYHDHQTHDARLAIAALRAAAASGAVVATHAEVVALRFADGTVSGADVEDRLGGGSFTVEARTVVNAAGPWVDAVRRMEDPGAGTSVVLSKGAHVLLAGGEDWTAAVTTPLPGGRVSFAIPWEGMLLLGTTDEPFDGDPAAVEATEADVAQILAEAGRSLSADVLAPALVRSRFAGVRVLPASDSSTIRTRRETVVTRGRRGMVSVAGGKLTTWRLIGARTARRALAPLGGRQVSTRPVALPGAAPLGTVERALAASHPELPGDVRRHLARHHGTCAAGVLAQAASDPELLERIHPGGPDIWAQAAYARDQEWAATVDDVLRGRTTVALRGLDDAGVRDAVARMLARGRR
jgi:glycerol-3-phosphate dehydrogenase